LPISIHLAMAVFSRTLGYNPRTDPETVSIDVERARYWLSVGAQPSESVARLLKTHGLIEAQQAA